ncbi:hypothetical protein P3W45_000739 [Vairimorpha bombi]|jgi:Ca2+-binding EF-hand superfamily protein
MYLKERVRRAIKYEGEINISDIQNLKNLKNNPLSQRLLLRYSEDGVVKFDEMFSDLQTFVSSKEVSTKLKVLFKIYDSDKDGLITKLDLFEIIKTYSECKNEKTIMDIVNSTFDEAGVYLEVLDFDQFKDIILCKSLNLRKLLRC